MGWNARDAKASDVSPNICSEVNVYPFDTRDEEIILTCEICVENPNQIGVNVTGELNERVQVLVGDKLWEGKAVIAKEGYFNMLVVDDFAIAEGFIEVFLSGAVTDPTINIRIPLLGGHALDTFARGRGGCHGGVVEGVGDGGADVERGGGPRVFEGLESTRVLGAEVKAAIKSREFTYLMD